MSKIVDELKQWDKNFVVEDYLDTDKHVFISEPQALIDAEIMDQVTQSTDDAEEADDVDIA